MEKFICKVCGYVHEGAEAPEACPQCKAPKAQFVAQSQTDLSWADEHFVGVAKDVDKEILERIKTKLHGRVYRSRNVLSYEPSSR